MITKILLTEIELMIQKAYNQEKEDFITYGGLNEELEDLELYGSLSDIDNAEVMYQKKKKSGLVWFKANNPNELDKFYCDIMDGIYDSELEYIEEQLKNGEGILSTESMVVEVHTGGGIVDDMLYIRIGNILMQVGVVHEDLKQHIINAIEI